MGFQCRLIAVEAKHVDKLQDWGSLSKYVVEVGHSTEKMFVLEQIAEGMDIWLAGQVNIEEGDFPKGFLTKTGTPLFSLYDDPGTNIRVFSPTEVVCINHFLKNLNKKILIDNFDLDLLITNTYPYDRWYTMYSGEDEPETDTLIALFEELGQLRDFIQRVADSSLALVVWHG
jgi:hypothetical protein